MGMPKGWGTAAAVSVFKSFKASLKWHRFAQATEEGRHMTSLHGTTPTKNREFLLLHAKSHNLSRPSSSSSCCSSAWCAGGVLLAS